MTHTTDISQVLSEGRHAGQLIGVRIDDKVFGAKILEVLHDDETKLCVEIICEGEGCWQRIDGGGCNGGDGKP